MHDKTRTNTDSQDIKKEIEKFLFDNFDIPKESVAERGEENFFGLDGLLNPRELTYLARMLETRYGIQFSMEEYDSPEFYNLSGLSGMVAGMTAENSQEEGI